MTWQDIRVGHSIEIMGKQLLILEADEATQEFYVKQGVPNETMVPLQIANLQAPSGPGLHHPDGPYHKMPQKTKQLLQQASIRRCVTFPSKLDCCTP